MDYFAIMKTEESLVSRRSFFRSTAQVVLPMLALTILSSCAPAKKLRTAPSTCQGTCTGTCKVSCGSICGGTCARSCTYMCQHCNYK